MPTSSFTCNERESPCRSYLPRSRPESITIGHQGRATTCTRMQRTLSRALSTDCGVLHTSPRCSASLLAKGTAISQKVVTPSSSPICAAVRLMACKEWVQANQINVRIGGLELGMGEFRRLQSLHQGMIMTRGTGGKSHMQQAYRVLCICTAHHANNSLAIARRPWSAHACSLLHLACTDLPMLVNLAPIPSHGAQPQHTACHMESTT